MGADSLFSDGAFVMSAWIDHKHHSMRTWPGPEAGSRVVAYVGHHWESDHEGLPRHGGWWIRLTYTKPGAAHPEAIKTYPLGPPGWSSREEAKEVVERRVLSTVLPVRLGYPAIKAFRERVKNPARKKAPSKYTPAEVREIKACLRAYNGKRTRSDTWDQALTTLHHYGIDPKRLPAWLKGKKKNPGSSWFVHFIDEQGNRLYVEVDTQAEAEAWAKRELAAAGPGFRVTSIRPARSNPRVSKKALKAFMGEHNKKLDAEYKAKEAAANALRASKPFTWSAPLGDARDSAGMCFLRSAEDGSYWRHLKPYLKETATRVSISIPPSANGYVRYAVHSAFAGSDHPQAWKPRNAFDAWADLTGGLDGPGGEA